MGGFIKRRFPEYLLCVGLCLGLNMAVLSGYVLTGPIASSVLITAEAVAVIVALLYLFAFNRLTVGIGVFVGAVLAAFTVFYMHLSDPLADETANSLFVFVLVSVCVCLLAFLLTRTKTGCIATIALGALVIGGAKFLDFPVPLWALLLFLPCAAAMTLMRVYGKSMRQVFTGMVRSWRYFAQVAGVVLVSLAMACAVFFAVIVPLNPPTKDLELLSILRNMQTMDVLGLSQTRQVYDPDLLSSGALQDQRDGNQEGENQGDQQEGQAPDAQNDPVDETQGGEDETGSTDWLQNPYLEEFLKALRFDHPEMWAFAAVIVAVLVIAAVFAGKILLRRRWHHRVQELPPRDAVLNFYRFFLRRLGMAGYVKAPTTTLAEYAQLTEHPLQPFAVDGVTFAALTDIYLRTFYGGAEASANDVQQFETFYGPFYQNLRREMGIFAYARKFFRM